MQAYEFLAKPENGTIPIPGELRNKITSDVKVIVLELKADGSGPGKSVAARKSELLLPPALDTAGWKFDRREANER